MLCALPYLRGTKIDVGGAARYAKLVILLKPYFLAAVFPNYLWHRGVVGIDFDQGDILGNELVGSGQVQCIRVVPALPGYELLLGNGLAGVGYLVALGDPVRSHIFIIEYHDSIVRGDEIEQLPQSALLVIVHQVRTAQCVLRGVIVHAIGQRANIVYRAALLLEAKAKISKPCLLLIQPLFRPLVAQHSRIGEQQLQYPWVIPGAGLGEIDTDAEQGTAPPPQPGSRRYTLRQALGL